MARRNPPFDGLMGCLSSTQKKRLSGSNHLVMVGATRNVKPPCEMARSIFLSFSWHGMPSLLFFYCPQCPCNSGSWQETSFSATQMHFADSCVFGLHWNLNWGFQRWISTTQNLAYFSINCVSQKMSKKKGVWDNDLCCDFLQQHLGVPEYLVSGTIGLHPSNAGTTSAMR